MKIIIESVDAFSSFAFFIIRIPRNIVFLFKYLDLNNKIYNKGTIINKAYSGKKKRINLFLVSSFYRAIYLNNYFFFLRNFLKYFFNGIIKDGFKNIIRKFGIDLLKRFYIIRGKPRINTLTGFIDFVDFIDFIVSNKRGIYLI